MSKYDQYRIMANKAIQSLVDSGAVRPENIAIREDTLAALFLNAERNYEGQRAPSTPFH